MTLLERLPGLPTLPCQGALGFAPLESARDSPSFLPPKAQTQPRCRSSAGNIRPRTSNPPPPSPNQSRGPHLRAGSPFSTLSVPEYTAPDSVPFPPTPNLSPAVPNYPVGPDPNRSRVRAFTPDPAFADLKSQSLDQCQVPSPQPVSGLFLGRRLSHPSPRVRVSTPPAFLHIRHLGRPSKHLEEGGIARDLAVVTEAVEACLPSPWKPRQRPARGPRGACSGTRQARVHNPRPLCALGASGSPKVECPTLLSPTPKHPGTGAPELTPCPAPGCRVTAGRFPAESHLLLQQDAAQSHFQDGAERRQRPRRGGVSKVGVRSDAGGATTLPSGAGIGRLAVGRGRGTERGRCWDGGMGGGELYSMVSGDFFEPQ